MLRAVLAVLLSAGLILAAVTMNRGPIGALMFHRAERLSASVLSTPETASPKAVDQAIERFMGVAKFAKGTAWATSALDRVGRLAFTQRRYAEARKAFQPICRMYGSDVEMCMMSRVFIGRCYEAEGNLAAAAQTYEGMEQFHPWTPLWIEAPLFAPQLYERHGKPEQALEAYKRAKAVCLRRLRGTLDPDNMDALRWQLATVYEALGAWPEAAQVYEGALVADSRHDMKKRADMWYRLARIYEERLQQPRKARDAYRQLISEFPQHPSATQAQERLTRLSMRRDLGSR